MNSKHAAKIELHTQTSKNNKDRILASLIFTWSILTGCSNPPPPDSPNPESDTACQYCNIELWAKDVSKKHIIGPVIQFYFHADELIRRKRKGRFIEFENQYELYLRNVTITNKLRKKYLTINLNEILTEPQNKVQDQTQNNDNDAQNKKLSRILIDNTEITFIPLRSAHTIKLSAGHAKILTETMIMQLEDNITVRTHRCQLDANIAIWSTQHNELYFPNGYRLNKKTHQNPASFSILNNGRCQKAKFIKNIQYIDSLEQLENELLDTMPMTIRLLFGLI